MFEMTHKLACLCTMAVLLVASISIISMAVFSATPAKAQAPSISLPKSISGNYSNSDTGIQISLPAGWSGNEISSSNMLTAIVAPGGLMTQTNSTILMTINVSDKKQSDNNPPLPQPPNTSKQPDCNQTSSASSLSSSPSATTTTTTIKLSGVNATETVMQCTLDNGSSMKLKVDALQTDKKWVTVSLMAIPPSVYDSEVAAFDSSVKTLKVANAIDLSATVNGEKSQASQLELSNHTEKILLKSSSIELAAANGTAASNSTATGNEIDLNIQSSSNVTDFSFNQTSKQISFKVSGQSGTNGTTIVQDVGKLLKGPYVVTFDGQVKTDYQTLTNKTTGDVIGIQITYHHSSHVITIAGAEVVPEFAVGGIGTITILGVVTGFLIFVRARLTSSRSRFFAIFTARSVAFLLVGGEIASMQPKFAAYAASPDLFVSTTDTSGNPLPGYYTTVSQGGTVIQYGFSPTSFSLPPGTYDVAVSDYGSYFFSHWSDGVTSRSHSVTIASTGTVTLTAIYSTSTPVSTGITVNSQYSDGSALSGMYVVLQQNGAVVDYGFTPKTFGSVTAGQSYTILPQDYTNAYFNHWSDGVTTRERTVTASSTPITLTAVYTKTQTTAPDFGISVLPATLTVAPGSSGMSNVTISSTNGFNSTVALSASSVPSGVTATFSPNTVTPPSGSYAGSTITFAASSTAAQGTYTVTITGTSGSVQHSTTMTLTVSGGTKSDFNILSSQNSLTLQNGTSGTSTITVSSINGFSSAVTLNASSSISGVTATFSPSSVTPAAGGSASSTLTVAAAANVAAGNYQLSVTGTNGTLTHSITIPLTVSSSSGTGSAKLVVATQDSAGNPITGYYTVLYQNGAVVTTGFSPATFTLNRNQQYTVEVQDYGSYHFNKWLDTGSTVRDRVVSISLDTTITAVYGSSTPPPQPDFSISSSPSSVSMQPGGSGSSTLSISSVNGFSSAVSLAASAIPGVTATFSPSSVTPAAGGSASSTLTIGASSSATAGTYTLTVTGTSGALSRTAAVTVTIQPSGTTGDFTIASSPASLTVQPGAFGTSTITIGSVSGFSSSVGLSSNSSSIAGVTTTFSPTSVTPAAGSSATSALTVNVSCSAVPGTYTLTATGTTSSSPALSHSASISLIVSQPSSPSCTPSGNNLFVPTKDITGNTLNGFWTAVTQGGTTVKTGFSPASFALPPGNYNVSVADYGSYYFNHWSDSVNTRVHPVTITSSGTVSLTALDRKSTRLNSSH